jgi:hypothetical protein
MTDQGWSSASFRCGRCGHKFTVTTEAEYIDRRDAHEHAHALIDALGLSPEIFEEAAYVLTRMAAVLRATARGGEAAKE